MLICKPKTSIVYLFSCLLLTGYVLVILWLYHVITSSSPSILSFISACFLLALLIFFSIRLAFGYILIMAEHNTLKVVYKLVGKVRTYALENLTDLQEERIKTFNNTEYKHLVLLFGIEKITVNNQVFEQYEALKNYLTQRRSLKRNKGKGRKR